MNPFYFLSPDNKSLFFLGATGAIPVLTFGRWWSLVTANFLHGSILHIVFNMIALKQLAPLVLTEYGTHRMIVIYLVSGVLGFLLSCLAGVSFTIGASASVCGLMGAILYFGKSRGGVYGQAVYGQIGGWVISLFVFGFIVPGINNWGHGGGLLAGILLGYLLGYKGRRPETQTHKVFAIICVLVTAAFLIWAVLSTMLSQVLTR
jgi:rhomboid protease GluP